MLKNKPMFKKNLDVDRVALDSLALNLCWYREKIRFFFFELSRVLDKAAESHVSHNYLYIYVKTTTTPKHIYYNSCNVLRTCNNAIIKMWCIVLYCL